MSARQLISSGSAFEAEIGYSRAVVVDDWVMVSGTTGFVLLCLCRLMSKPSLTILRRYNYETGEISSDVAAQAEQTMLNIDKALRDAGSSTADVVRVKYILPNRDDFPKTWPVLRKWFGSVKPAATMVQSQLMKEEMLIEIEVTAKKGCGAGVGSSS
jgi:enamine deaminase RidA (YjgF/YER057c/UK114 family)